MPAAIIRNMTDFELTVIKSFEELNETLKAIHECLKVLTD